MRADSEYRDDDERISREVGEFLEKTFYTQETTDFTRVEPKPLQIRGIDTVFVYNGKGYVCDEKCTGQYRDIETFILELSFIDRTGKPSVGWFLDETHVSNSYLFAWLDSDKVEAVLVEREPLVKHLESLGWTLPKLRVKQARVRNAMESGGHEPLGDLRRDGIRFNYTWGRVERPVTAMLPREVYRRLSVFDKCYPTTKFAEKPKR